MGTCEKCGAELVKPAMGRPQTRFCSRQCKEAVRAEAQKLVRLQKRTGRICEQCDKPIPKDRNNRAKTCTPECGVAYQNRMKQEAKRAAWEATKSPCKHCGGEIPSERHAGSKYCSFSCKQKEMGAYWRERMPGYMRQYIYGITPERFNEMLSEQGNRCAICRADVPGGKGGWHVDHCHDSGKIRGLLCHHCNIALGNFKDNIDSLRAAIDYLMAAEHLPEAPLTLR